MNVNGVTSQPPTKEAYSSTSKTTAKSTATSTTTNNTSGVVYEPSKDNTDKPNKIYKSNPELIAKIKSENEARTAQLRNLVEQMISKQGNTYGKATDMWQFLASGNFTVDAATKSQAQADIAEDGYWGVNQTSDRIIEFATALTGGDPSKISEMKDAFDKGFKAATKSWGKSLPEISSKTYDAVMSKFDKLSEESKI